MNGKMKNLPEPTKPRRILLFSLYSKTNSKCVSYLFFFLTFYFQKLKYLNDLTQLTTLKDFLCIY